jgi:broad specificity phosphatase PhoE
MTRVLLVRSGSTDLDQQGRIKGCLDMPLCSEGEQQVRDAAEQLRELPVTKVYCGPCECTRQTADILARSWGVRVKALDSFRNLDHGLWQGKLIEELRRQQPRLYRQLQECPETFSAPGGEAIQAAEERIDTCLAKLKSRHRGETIAVVVSEPLASLARARLKAGRLHDLWKAEQDACQWELIDTRIEALAGSGAGRH